jgi:hypothetical protein
MFDLPTPSIGGGAIDPLTGLLVLGLAACGFTARSRSGREER